ncbi:hypothetical protein GCM10010096_36420 [Alcaligenes pakistanensis]|uniref:Uncharacterized protein n=1 Tax=Alcaligenes pakistanensis TaxID=1482717 RepID=A0A8H9IMG1_9BURK|nr:hypothetical protein GCM10010096_36420 [Alcaligenes pakistanensis]
MTIEIIGAKTGTISGNTLENVAKPFIIKNCGDIEANDNHAFSSVDYLISNSDIYGSLREYYLQGLICAQE